MAEVSFEAVDIVFGPDPSEALALLDAGGGRDDILKKTGHVLGVVGADLTVERGEICVLMGLSGSGKSTLLRSVNGLNKVTRGNVLVQNDGAQVDVSRCDAATLRHLRTRRIAMVFQQFALLPWRTVRENVGFGLEIRGMNADERSQIVDSMLGTVGLEQWADSYADELSGGMQQRVGLARAFATDADILLMDEPFSALDPLIRSRLQDELLDLQQKLQKTIIFVSHDLDEAMKIGSHIAIMEDGRIVQNGAPEAIVLDPVNDYVADFVAHMNPLNVLRGVSVMTPLGEMETRDGDVLLDPIGRIRLALADGALPGEAMVGGRSAPIVGWDPGSGIDDRLTGQITAAPSTITLRTALELRHQSGHPVLLVHDGRMVGMIGDDEIHQGILRQTMIKSG
ncbi:MAG: choline ABC transporter ATP-binding protein [Geminicoccaceae bacterium]